MGSGVGMTGKVKVLGWGFIVLGTVWVWSSGARVGAVWPSLCALLGVILMGKALPGLALGALVGVFLEVNGRLWLMGHVLVGEHLLPQFASSWKIGAVLFTLILGGFVQVLERGGGIQAVMGRLLAGGGRRRVEAGAMSFGFVCFFDGLANSLLVGRLFKPMMGLRGLSRLRLAYIVDTTSAAVACLAVISTWIAFQLSMIAEGYALAGREGGESVYKVFFASIPYNSYALFSLLLLGYVVWTGWNLAGMGADAGQAQPCAPEPEVAWDTGVPGGGGLWRAGVPLAVLIVYTFVGIYLDGVAQLGAGVLPITLGKVSAAFGQAQVPVVLVTASLLAAGLAIALNKAGSASAAKAFGEGVVALLQPVGILITAWVLSSLLGALGAADYLGEWLSGRLPIAALPVMIFLLGALVSFTTGTSWGTMGLLMPLAIPLAFALGGAEAQVLIPVIVAAVFSGAVFGDHCSPLSDTTIVSAYACGVEPMDHVRTQIPYAVIAAGGALLLGFLPAGFVQAGVLHFAAGAAAFLTLCVVARRWLARKARSANS